ncbi:PREDICTED: type 2 lactosamine alpha-2,3-sialyltransferase-like, partial [Nanorana parkeri]|uniref:type 2 lactosamine alpha-2,3-sialyltransferase-like n=1 Tax=Nanorana parkeri TaxID=125878 RepID=UPI0008540D58
MYQGLLVMRKFLFVGIVVAAVLHFILHLCFQKKIFFTSIVPIQETCTGLKSSTADTVNYALRFPTDTNTEFKSCYNAKFHLILNASNIEPFMCEDYRRKYEMLGSNRLELPYGTRRGDRYFDTALRKLPKCDLPDEIRNISCKKCVVVGNGGVLRNSTLGKKIDSYDVIIRMNDGPVLGYEDDVGQKTTFRLCYPESIFSDSSHYDPNTTVVVMMFKPHDVKWLSDLLLHRKVSYTSSRLLVYYPKADIK